MVRYDGHALPLVFGSPSVGALLSRILDRWSGAWVLASSNDVFLTVRASQVATISQLIQKEFATACTST